MKFLFIKVMLGFIGSFFFLISLISIFFIAKTIYFSEDNLLNYLFSNHEYCENENFKKNSSICLDIATLYWVFVISIFSSIITFITLFPFFIIKKNHDKKLK